MTLFYIWLKIQISDDAYLPHSLQMMITNSATDKMAVRLGEDINLDKCH